MKSFPLSDTVRSLSCIPSYGHGDGRALAARRSGRGGPTLHRDRHNAWCIPQVVSHCKPTVDNSGGSTVRTLKCNPDARGRVKLEDEADEF